MRKAFTVLLVAAMLFSLAACGNADSETETRPDSSSTTTQSSTPTEPATDPHNGMSSTLETNPAVSDADPAGSPSSEVDGDTATEPTDDGTKILIAYFSATGTTKKIAEYAADALGADLYEIVPANPYTSADLNYNASDCRANTEMNDPSCRPEISGSVDHMADYDIVFIGYPIWWGEAPRIVSTFIESYDFSGKTVVTFSTSGGSGHNDRSIKELVSDADWVTGARLKSNSTQSDVTEWISGLGLGITVR